ncbi:PIN domain-containing protein [Patescibacteria group bacterium]|nr:PIN domain-containing protein [Patescibacteria group bacterium]MBU4017235.1 PIN domain-containing protein [Patescibacteria group bacterium]MBU4098599.1 PIN domain-containing protein [Patescibacteria group bacterium]
MIFVDTNYFLRFLLNDISEQHKQVKDLFLSGSEGKINLVTSTIVIFEIYWVLSSYYEKEKIEIVKVLEKILKLTFIKLEERDLLLNSLKLFERANFDLEDCYNLYYAKHQKADSFKTFDIPLRFEFTNKLVYTSVAFKIKSRLPLKSKL